MGKPEKEVPVTMGLGGEVIGTVTDIDMTTGIATITLQDSTVTKFRIPGLSALDIPGLSISTPPVAELETPADRERQRQQPMWRGDREYLQAQHELDWTPERYGGRK